MKPKTYDLRSIVMSTTLALATVIPMSIGAQLAPPSGESFGGSSPGSEKVVSGIAWYGVLKDGLLEATRTGKPILLVSAAPQCNGIPGMW